MAADATTDFKAITTPRVPADFVAVLHEALAAWGDDLDGAIEIMEAHPDETSPELLAALRYVRARRKPLAILQRGGLR